MDSKAARLKKARRARRSVLTVTEVSQVFGLSEWAIYKGIGKGQIPSVRVGRNVFVPLRKAREMWPELFDGDLSDVLVESHGNGKHGP